MNPEPKTDRYGLLGFCVLERMGMAIEQLHERRRTMSRHTDAEIRCHCGNMMGRTTSRGIEVKCRRCKRIHVIPLSALGHCHNSGETECR